MRHNMFFLLVVLFIGCHKENPITTEQSQLPDLPQVVVSPSDYTESAIQARVPNTTLKNKCCVNNNLTDSSRRKTVEVLLQKVQMLGQDTSVVSSCLKATGQTKDSMVSVLYLAEKAKYQSKECWIFEFAWGVVTSDLVHYRCFVMNASTKDTLLFITCR